MYSAGTTATGVTPSHTLVQELQLRASISAVRQLQLQVLRGVHLPASLGLPSAESVAVALRSFLQLTASAAPAVPTYDANNVGRRFSEPASGRARQLQESRSCSCIAQAVN